MSRVILVHDWLTGMRGGEKCLEVAARRWPDAPLYTLLHKVGSVSPLIENRRIRTSFLDHFPRSHTHYRYFLPLMPFAARSWRLPPADLVLSFSHCVAKSVRPASAGSERAKHVCYCFSPMRYAWQMRSAYFGGRLRGLSARLIDRILDALRDWDRATASGVDHFIAISRTIQERIRECYQRESTVIYPPVDTEYYTPASIPREDYYLIVSALAPYKRIDLAISACRRLNRKLIVIGSGQDAARLNNQRSENIDFLGWQPDSVIRDYFRSCKALLFPGEEDFGIVPVEAMSCGTAVIAFSRGGSSETVVPLGKTQPTGIWFSEQTVESLCDAVERFEASADEFDPQDARKQAERFSIRRFEESLFALLDDLMIRDDRLRKVA